MIAWFSGTGNSRYIAERIGEATGYPLLSINDELRAQYRNGTERKPERLPLPCNVLILVTPTYCYRIPRVVEQWLLEREWKPGTKVYFVLTCGTDANGAEIPAEAWCREHKLCYQGLAVIRMPENYLAMFPVPNAEQSRAIIAAAEESLKPVIAQIARGEAFAPCKKGILRRAKSGVVTKAFYRLFVKDKAFYATDACVQCRICEQVCPLVNIRLMNGTPQWNGHCTHCMACIGSCPKQAIEYGKRTGKRNRYTLDAVLKQGK